MTAIAAALSSLKAAKDIAEAMIGLRDTAAFQGKLLEFQSKLLDANNAAFAAQDERSSMLERIRDLEKEVADLKAWEAEKQRYEMKRFEPGVILYALKPEAASGEPPHYLCTACYKRGKPSPLQAQSDLRMRRRVHLCPECQTEYVFGPEAAPTPVGHAAADYDPFQNFRGTR